MEYKTKKDFKNDLKRTTKKWKKSELSEWGNGYLKAMQLYENLILCSSSKVVVEEIDSRQQIIDSIERLTRLL